MEPEIRNLVDIDDSEAALGSRARLMLERGWWAAEVFQRYDREATLRVVEAVARAAHDNAEKYAEWAVRESGFGVVEHKVIKNRLTALPLVEAYRDADFVTPKIDPAAKIVSVPRPAGVIFALAPSTNPIATVNFKVLLAMMTRNVIVVSPHPAVRECCADAARTLAAAAEAAGAPPAAIQVIEKPNLPLIEHFMRSDRTALILATGGTAMVRAAYSSSNPAIGVGPGNAPVFVDATADLAKAARRIVESKSFDNSILCTNESVLVTTVDAKKRLVNELERAGAHVCDAEERDQLRRYLFHERGFNVEAIGRDALWIANECGIRVPTKTRILVAPVDKVGIEEPLSKEKLCPVLAMYVAGGNGQAIAAARAVVRMSGAGHSAAIHSTDERTVMAYASAVETYRCVVNAPCSQGASGFDTHLAPSFTVGTGYFGRSSLGENLKPDHLVQWTRIAYNSDDSEPMGNYAGLTQRLDGPLPQAPSDGVPGLGGAASAPPRRAAETSAGGLDAATRAELRRLIAEELRNVLKDNS